MLLNVLIICIRSKLLKFRQTERGSGKGEGGQLLVGYFCGLLPTSPKPLPNVTHDPPLLRSQEITWNPPA